MPLNKWTYLHISFCADIWNFYTSKFAVISAFILWMFIGKEGIEYRFSENYVDVDKNERLRETKRQREREGGKERKK